jgi:hypothetical protein
LLDRIAARKGEKQRENPKNAPHGGSQTTDTSFQVNRGQSDVAGGDQAGETNRNGARSGPLTSHVARACHAK